MKKVILILGLLLLVGSLMLGTVALAQTGVTITRDISGSAGGQMTGGNYVLNGTLGESIAGEPTWAGSYSIGSGFWAGSSGAGNAIYLPLVIKGE